MNEELLRQFFADVKVMLNINLGPWCERNLINKSEFSLFMHNRKNHLNLMQLEQMKQDIIENIESYLDFIKNA